MDQALANFGAAMNGAITSLSEAIAKDMKMRDKAMKKRDAELNGRIEEQNEKIEELSATVAKVQFRDVLNQFKFVISRKFMAANKSPSPSFEELAVMIENEDKAILKMIESTEGLDMEMLKHGFETKYDILAHVQAFEKERPKKKDKAMIEEMVIKCTPEKVAPFERMVEFLFEEDNWMPKSPKKKAGPALSSSPIKKPRKH